jgi:hypothetical protein
MQPSGIIKPAMKILINVLYIYKQRISCIKLEIDYGYNIAHHMLNRITQIITEME